MPHFPRQPWCVLVLLSAGLTLPLAWAAPTTAEPAQEAEAPNGPNGPLGGADPIDLSSGTDAPGSSRTLKMLLELQAAPAQADAAASAAPRGLVPKSRVAAAAPPGEAPLPASAARRAFDDEAVGWGSGLGGGSLGISRGAGGANAGGYGQGLYATAPTTRGTGGGGGDGGNTSSLLPQRWIAFLRENRDWVLGGSIALLALLGVGASFNSQRRR